MKQIFRLKDIEIDGYYFPLHQGLYWHSGEFWFNETKCKKVYNNGSISVLVDNSKLSIKKLRKQATKCKIKLLKHILPF
jgi:Neuraminidase (sialidase)